MSIKERFRELDSRRIRKLERSRYVASLTVPSVLPPAGWTNEEQLPQPFSSIPARGVVGMASRMLSAMLPVNDTPFFKFSLRPGTEPDPEVNSYLEAMSSQVYRKINSKNLREIIFQALQHLIVVGDSIVIMEDDFSFRVIRFDHFVMRREVNGEPKEIIYLEFVARSNDEAIEDNFRSQYSADYASEGYDVVYTRLTKEEDGNEWFVEREQDEKIIETGSYKVFPIIPLRWTSVAGENYGRSHCEDIAGDIQSLEAFTEASQEGMAAASTFWMGVDPAGITEIDDLAGQANGSWVSARQQDVIALSPAQTLNPQIQATFQAVETMRREVGQAFLLDSAAIPSGDRVTATAVRRIGQELETVLGGAFSSIARELFVPIVERAVFLMLEEGEIDQRLQDQFFEDGTLKVEIITGLQALSRDTDLMKLMQMGEMMRNLPQEAMQTFKFEEYGRALITALGFDANNWIRTEEDIKAEQAEQQREAMAMQQQAATQQAVTQGVSQAAMMDLEQSGGQGIQQAMQGMQQPPM
jgi:hypothetical protein